MQKNKLKALWSSGQPILNGWCSIGNSFTAEIMAAQGYDSVTVDIQHGALDYSDVYRCSRRCNLQVQHLWHVCLGAIQVI